MDAYDILRECNALYESPKDDQGKYIGPLVAYAGMDETGKNFVGFHYVNIAQAEQGFESRMELSKIMSEKILEAVGKPDRLIAAPMGGIIFSVSTANFLESRVSFFEKKVKKLADPVNNIREESDLVYGRHNLETGEKVIIFEDLCNNFSTTEKMVELLRGMGAEVVAIACIFNRSERSEFMGIPVVSVLHIPIPEYKQDDPVVKSIVESGNIVLSPKKEWPRLKEAMEKK
ncbi:MAG: phosphoribosyltransferase family protein [Candidatus Shapirobacteria bacterium]|nr:phosphoribosyltransferase family protein [Candidatus Shapirobacteria bacterium]